MRLHACNPRRSLGYAAATAAVGPGWDDGHFAAAGHDEARVSVRERVAVAAERGVGAVEDGGGEEVVDVEAVVPVGEGACCFS